MIRTRAGVRAGDQLGERYATASLPRRGTPWRQARWCALDFELTGLDPRVDEVISFGAIPIEDGRVVLAEAVRGLARPAAEIGESAIRVHGIRAADLARAPLLADAIDPLIAVLSGRVLVCHFASVERAFLTRALAQRGLRMRGPIVDTEVLGKVWLHDRDGGLRAHLGLGELAAALGLPAEYPHDALADALSTAQAFVALASHLDARHRETVGSLARAGRRLESLRVFNPR